MTKPRHTRRELWTDVWPGGSGRRPTFCNNEHTGLRNAYDEISALLNGSIEQLLYLRISTEWDILYDKRESRTKQRVAYQLGSSGKARQQVRRRGQGRETAFLGRFVMRQGARAAAAGSRAARFGRQIGSERRGRGRFSEIIKNCEKTSK
ncbi:uncharacterized protein LOC143350286 isoform X1 [Colletes latitarsis]|uniref:uncharacterized protein LOC143350286 isoform X1 n=1 Tax=Colletes latitarsis TaxID=2605962 RepID=UPI0040357670